MMRKVIGLVGAVGAAGFTAADLQRRRILAEPDPYPVEEISVDPVGDTHWVDRPDGTRIRAVVAGEGSTVVLAHGYGVSLLEWNVVMNRLVADGHRVIAFDWRGQGQTRVGSDGITPEVVAADFAAVLAHFDVTDGVLVGHSTGGYLSIAALLDHPDAAARVRGLVLLASLAGEASVDAPQTKLQIPLIKAGIMQRIAATERLGFAFAASIYGPGASAGPCQVFLDEFVRSDHQALIPLLHRLATTGYYDRLHEITVPTVVICGEKDSTTPRWHSETMGERIPGARNVWVPDAGHMLNWQAPDTVIAAVEQLSVQ